MIMLESSDGTEGGGTELGSPPPLSCATVFNFSLCRVNSGALTISYKSPDFNLNTSI